MQIVNVKAAMDFFKSKCRERNLKITPQRTVIYEELLKATDHPSIDAILKRVRRTFPNISFDTVYRTLFTFSDLGIIRIVEGYGGSKRFDPNVAQHHHFRCLKCHKIIDFYSEYYDSIEIPHELRKQFEVLNKNVWLEGVCAQCRKKR